MSDVQPKNFIVERIRLHSPNIGGANIDISKLMIDFTISENLFHTFLSGSITILDKAGYFELFPILGEELLEVNILSANDDLLTSNRRTIRGLFRIYQASPLHRDGQNPGATYTLYFTSNEYFIDRRTKIFDSYLNDPKQKLSFIAKTVFETYIKNNNFYKDEFPQYQKEIEVEDTLRQYEIIFPNMSPFNAIKLCASKAISKSTKYRGASYIFYEELEKFHFVSLESLLDKQPVLTLIYSPELDNPNVQSLDVMQNRANSREYEKVEEFEIMKSFDVLDNVDQGMYSSRLITYDFERMKYQEYDFEYVNQTDFKRKVKREDGQIVETVKKSKKDGNLEVLNDKSKSFNPLGKLCTQNNDNLNHPMQKVHLQSTTKDHDIQYEINQKVAGGFKDPGIIPDGVEEQLLQRNSLFQQFENIRVKVILKNSNNTIKVGDVVDFEMPSEIADELLSNVPPSTHFYYGGRYLISKITRIIVGSSGVNTTLELVKNSIDNPMPDFDPQTVRINELAASQNPEVETLNTPNFARAREGGGL